MTPDPYAPYLRQAEDLFTRGEIVKAGQIWQAILKQQPAHAEARERLLALRERLLAQRAAEEAQAAALRAPAPPPPPPPSPVPPPAPEPPPAPPEPEPPQPAPADPAVGPDRLVREGCTLYDMGLVAEALQKWEQVLALDPAHALAQGYANGARRELGLVPVEATATTPAEAPPAPEEAPAPPEEEDVATLLREAVQLYDMGLTEEAISKWKRVLVLEPHRTEVQTYLDQATRELADAPHPSPAVPAPADPDAQALALKLRQAEHLLALQRPEEAAFTYQQALALAPGHPAVLEGLRRCQQPRSAETPAAASDAYLEPLGHIAMAEEELALPVSDGGPVEPPASLVKATAAPREGLALPDRLHQVSERLPWLREPKTWILAGGGALALTVGLVALHSYRQDQELKEAVKRARAAAVAPVLQQAQAPDLTEASDAILQEGQAVLDSDPVRAYARAQALLARQPGDAAGAQLLEKARAALPGGATGASLPEFQKHLQNGDLEAAARVMDALLRGQPDDADLRARAARLHLQLCSAHAAQGKWTEAEDDLRRGRALFPADKMWQARLRLLDRVKGMPKAQQPSWIPLLG